MLPVSTFGLSGSIRTDLLIIRGTLNNSIQLNNIQQMDEEETTPEITTYPGYFAFDVFLKNSSRQDELDDVLQLNYDSSLEIMETENSATGLQNTARVAFAKYGGTSDTMADAATILKETAGIGVGGSPVYITDVAIWEPNSNDHVDYVVQNNNKITGAGASFNATTQMDTYALTDNSKGQSIADIYTWDGTETLVQKQNVLQTTKTSAGDDDTPADYSIAEGVQNLVSTSDGTTEFGIAPNKICRIRIYVWLEGQDVDCINYASHGGGVRVNIGLVKGSVIGSHEITGD